MTIIAVACDLLENISLLQLINSGPDDGYARAAFIFAAIKFLLLAMVLLHLLVAMLIPHNGK